MLKVVTQYKKMKWQVYKVMS